MQPKSNEAIKARVQIWRVRPDVWVDDIFGDAIKLSNQQKEACIELGKVVAAKIKRSKGLELVEEDAEYAKKIGVSISSGMGLGKDFFASLLIFWLLHVFPEEQGQAPHILATANTAKQLSNVLWRQAAAIPAMSKPCDPQNPRMFNPKDGGSGTILQQLFVCNAEKIYRREREGKTFFAEAVTVSPNASSDEQSRALTGRHAPYMLMLLDEAAGIPNPVFENLEGTLSGRVNLLIMIYNPIKSNGYAIDSHRKYKDKWVCLKWNGEEAFFDNPALDIPIKERNKDLLERYGRDSNAYRIRVLGLPPINDKDVFIPWDWVQDSIDREITPSDNDPVIMGVDPAAGGDNSVIVTRQGGKVIGLTRFNLSDTMDFTGRVIAEIHKYDPAIVCIDPIGVGKGVYDRLSEQGFKVCAVDVRRKPRDAERFERTRDELWWKLREQFEKGIISIPNDQGLIDQLTTIKVKKYTSQGAMSIPTKAEMKRSGSIGFSPDEADALCLTYYYDDAVFRQVDNDDDEDDERNRRRDRKRNYKTGY